METPVEARSAFASIRQRLAKTPLRDPWRWMTSFARALRQPSLFGQVETYCLFLGHGRSGHSIVGALLDAHPDIILSDEVDTLRYVGTLFSRDQVFHLSAEVAARQARSLRRKAGRGGRAYSYFVPGQWQGRVRQPRVVGDSRAAGTVRRLAGNPALLEKLRVMMTGLQLRFIHVIRNPYDTIATMMVRTGRTFESAFDEYFSNWDALEQAKRQIRSEEVMAIRHEDLLAEPRGQLARLCEFLGVESDDPYLDACADILYTSPSKSRHAIEWTEEWRRRLAQRVAQVEELEGYSFDS